MRSHIHTAPALEPWEVTESHTINGPTSQLFGILQRLDRIKPELPDWYAGATDDLQAKATAQSLDAAQAIEVAHLAVIHMSLTLRYEGPPERRVFDQISAHFFDKVNGLLSDHKAKASIGQEVIAQARLVSAALGSQSPNSPALLAVVTHPMALLVTTTLLHKRWELNPKSPKFKIWRDSWAALRRFGPVTIGH